HLPAIFSVARYRVARRLGSRSIPRRMRRDSSERRRFDTFRCWNGTLQRTKWRYFVMQATRSPGKGAAAAPWRAAAAVAAFTLCLTATTRAQDAEKILKAMSDYVTSQKTLSLTFDSDIEVITSELQKIQFASSGQVLLSRPDKMRATRTGGYADVELVFDGKTVTVLGKNVNAFAQADAPGTVDQLIDRLRDQLDV